MQKQKIIINGRFLSQRLTGVNRFAFEMCKALYRLNVDFLVVAPPKILPSYRTDFPVLRWGILSGPAWEMTDLPVYLCLHKRPLLISFSGLGPLCYRNQFITIHDLAYLENPSWYSKSYSLFYKFCTPVLAHHAEKIMTVSRFSLSEIVRRLSIPEDKIKVIYNAVDFSGIVPVRPANLKTEKFILCVGSLDPRKNLQMVVEAYNRSGLSSAYQLVLVGKGDKIFRMVGSAQINANQVGYVSDAELVWLYNNASLFVYPSLFEGFGIPVLEAMALNCPVILSDIPVFRELFEGAARFVNPENADNLAVEMKIVLSNPHIREVMIRRGSEVAKRFSWEHSAKKVMELFVSQI